MKPAPDGEAPYPTLPLRYLVAATLAFVTAALGVPALASDLAGHYYHPRILALTHVVTLGWITLAIMGAGYQLIPVVLQRPLWSERLARWQFVMVVVGAIGMISHFFMAEWSGLMWAAGVLILGVAAHVVNVAVSLRGLARGTFTARLMAMALVGLAATTVFGALLGMQHVRAFLPVDFFSALHAHVHLALLGWVAGCTVIWSALFTVGNFLYGRTSYALLLLGVCIASGLALLHVMNKLWAEGRSYTKQSA